jgi:hypothetical protein
VSRQWQEIRLSPSRPGSRSRVVILPASFRIQGGDDVSLLYVRLTDDRKGPLVGVVNHTRRIYVAMPHGVNPFKLRSDPVWGTGMTLLKLYGIPVAALVLIALTWGFLHAFTDVRFPIPAWLVAWAIGAGILWVFGVVFEWREEIAERDVTQATESLLRAMAKENDFGQDAPTSREIRPRSTPSSFLRGDSVR